MKTNNTFEKIIFCVAVGILATAYFGLGQLKTKDDRTTVLAVHSCSSSGYPYVCSGGCDSGSSCRSTGIYSCSCFPNPTARPPTSEWNVSIPPIVYSCDGNQYCTAVCTGDCYGTVRCYEGTFTGAHECSALYNTWILKCCKTTGEIDLCTTCYDWPNSCGSGTLPGWYDDCGGTGCGTCDGGGVVVPTSVPPTTIPGDPTPTTCPNTCATNECRDYICSNDRCQDSCGNWCTGKLPCLAPVFQSLTIKNANFVAVTADVNSRNQICENTFANSSVPRRVIVEAVVSDIDGFADIIVVNVSWNGNTYGMVYEPGSGVGTSAMYVATIDFTSAENNSGTYPIEIFAADSRYNTNGLVNSGRSLKVWDCLIPVSGALYDGSLGQTCNLNGFSNLIASDTNFLTLLFNNIMVGAGVSATVSLPNSYGSNNLVWSKTYQPIFNGGDVSDADGDLLATGRMTRIIDLGTGVTTCPDSEFVIGSNVSAYSTNPSARVDFSFVLDQDGWFQVAGAGVKAKNEISSGVPITASDLTRALSVSNAVADNGLVSFSNFRNINANNGSISYGLTNNWWVNRNTNDTTAYSYQYFYNNLFINRDMGTTGTDWAGKPSEGVYFVNGDLNIDVGSTLAAGKTLLVVVKGKITIADTVDRVDGIFISDGNSGDNSGIEASGYSDTQLVINGMLFSRKNIRLNRSYTTKSLNNDAPSVKISYRPDLIFNMPGTLMRVLSGWKTE